MRIRINRLNVTSSAGYGDVYRFDVTNATYVYNFGFNAGVSVFGIPFNYNYEYGNNAGANLIRPRFTLRLDLSQYENKFVFPDFALQDSLVNKLAQLESELHVAQRKINTHNRRFDQLAQGVNTDVPTDSIYTVETTPLNYSDSLVSTLELIKQEKARIDSLHSKVFEVRSRMEELKNASQAKPNKLFATKRFAPKVLSVGMSTPEVGVFLMQGMNIRGLYTVVNSKKYSHSIAFGTVNSFLLNDATGSPFESFQNRVSSLTRLNSSSADRRVLSYKFSKGNSDSTHFYIGGLAGTGKKNLLQSTGEQARNFVGEFGKGLLIPHVGLVTASVSQSWISNFTGVRNDFNDIDDENSLTGYAFNVKAKGAYKLIGLDYTIQTTLITPEFSSYGFALQRRDYLRFDAGGTKRFKNNSQIKFSHRRDESNLFESSEVSTRSNLYRFGYAIKIKRQVFLNNDFIYLKNATWGQDFKFIESWFMNNFNGFVLFPKSKSEEIINISVNYNQSSRNRNSYTVDGFYGMRLSKSVQSRTRLVHQSQKLDNQITSLESIMQTIDYTYKSWVFGVTSGILINAADVDWNSSIMVSKMEGRVSCSLIAERLIPNSMLPIFDEQVIRPMNNPFRLFLQFNYAILD